MEYFEGYYCKDETSLDGIKTKTSRKVLYTISQHYPFGITANEISRKTKIPTDTVRGSLKTLEDAGFILKAKDEKRRGKPGKGDSRIDTRSFRYHIENRNFALNEDSKYQLAPGYTKYTPDFLYAWKVLIEQDQLYEVNSLLTKILRQVMTKMTSSNDPKLRRLMPNPEISKNDETITMCCRHCGVNHEGRDFLRATLLHLLDQFETSSQYRSFIKEYQFSSTGNEDIPKALLTIAEESSIKSEADTQSPSYEKLSKSPDLPIVVVEESQTKDGIKVTLHRIEFAAEYSVVFLTIENASNNHKIRFGEKGSRAIQGDYEFKVTSKGPNYISFRKNIEYGTKGYGAVKFEALYYHGPSIRFELPIIKDFPDSYFGSPSPSWLFIFEVQIQK